ncbi:MAG: serine/threonine protein kinase, partial [Planctomycetota bacterium]
MEPDEGEIQWDFGALPGEVAQRSPPRFVPGASLGPYTLLERLGRGGGGTVYRARDPSGREVAVKLVREDLGPRARERFRREGELLARLRHPGILRVHSGGTVSGRPFLVTELIEDARDTEAYLAELPRDERLAFLLEVAAALAAAHRLGIVHRDVKPGNILVDRQGRPRLADFGLALAPDHERLSRTGEVVGTPFAMAPEQWRRPGEVGPATDVWALGILLYKALCDRYPFDGRTLSEHVAQVLHRSPPPPGAGEALDAVCRKALARTPQERYADAGEFARALRAALAPEARSRPRKRLLGGFALGAGSLALLAGALLASGRPEARAPGPPKRTPLARSEGKEQRRRNPPPPAATANPRSPGAGGGASLPQKARHASLDEEALQALFARALAGDREARSILERAA